MARFSDLIDRERAIHLEPEELAHVVLRHLLSLPGSELRQLLHWREYCDQAGRSYFGARLDGDAPGQARAVKLDPAAPHGFFTGAFLGALADPMTDRNGDGAVQLSEIIDEVSRRVAIASRGEQTPWVARRDLFGDFKLADAARP